MVQLLEAVKAVFRSWDNPRAIVYRRMHDIGGRLGVERVSGQPRRVIDAAGIERLISIA